MPGVREKEKMKNIRVPGGFHLLLSLCSYLGKRVKIQVNNGVTLICNSKSHVGRIS